jgi:protein-tyrosine-phosphatase
MTTTRPAHIPDMPRTLPIIDSSDEAPRVLFVCTGNATRSVIGAALLRQAQPAWSIDSAGTFAIPGLPSSVRTLAALESVGVAAPGHRSTTLGVRHVESVDLVIGFEIDHVRFMRRRYPQVADRTATLRRLAAHDVHPWSLPAGLGEESLEDWMVTEDPAGGDVDVFVDCAQSIAADMSALIPRLRTWR